MKKRVTHSRSRVPVQTARREPGPEPAPLDEGAALFTASNLARLEAIAEALGCPSEVLVNNVICPVLELPASLVDDFDFTRDGQLGEEAAAEEARRIRARLKAMEGEGWRAEEISEAETGQEADGRALVAAIVPTDLAAKLAKAARERGFRDAGRFLAHLIFEAVDEETVTYREIRSASKTVLAGKAAMMMAREARARREAKKGGAHA